MSKIGDSEESFIVKYQNELYDITNFIPKHPGGINTLLGNNKKNIDKKFENVRHSSAAKYLLEGFKIRDKSINPKFDESMEHLIDWNSAMLPQISLLGDKYSEWVNKPVDRELKLFKNPFLEILTKTPWYLPLLFWIPAISILISNEVLTFDMSFANDFTSISLHLFFGIVLWTLVEYTLHRFVFHMNVGNSPALSTFHFLIHGQHHKAPFDENRLVFPPVPAAVLATIIYQPINLINLAFNNQLYNSRLLLAGGLIGYLCYDMIHYYIHHGSARNQYFYHLKRYHYNHHFVNHDKGFGISSPFWDALFGTRIFLKKLQYILKW